MKLILSRKGFDSTAGGAASPILPDGSMVSLPIPDARSVVRYRDLGLGALVEDLTHRRVRAAARAHADPDLARGAFGQEGAAQTVLARAGVGPGDLFLYFGWFRRAEPRDGRWRYVTGAPDLHVLWGWLQIGAVMDPADAPGWAASHPHVAHRARRHNTLYLARPTLTLAAGMPGAGTFARFADALVLTRPGSPRRSLWSLPACFDRALGYHAAASRWRRRGDRVELQSVARGQEFVLDLAARPAAADWLADLFATMRRC